MYCYLESENTVFITRRDVIVTYMYMYNSISDVIYLCNTNILNRVRSLSDCIIITL